MADIGANAYAFQKEVTLDAASIAAGTVAKETFVVTGLKAHRGPVMVEKRSETAGVVLIHSRISADDELELTFWNATAAAVNPASSIYYVVQV